VTVHLEAPAKLTLSLRVTGVRPDGMHLIDAEMVSLDLVDELELTELAPPARSSGASGGATSTLTVVDADTGAPHPVDAGPDNLVMRALQLVERSAAVLLRKRIPPGAGLGGGSSDAAAILRWARWSDLEAAARLGADVAYCLVGGRARVRGIGEVVDPLTFEARTLTLLTPPFGCSTPAVYRAWDDLGGPTADGPNDLEAAALVVEPRLARYRDLLGEAAGQTPRLAGSGSTWFVDGAHPGDGRVVVTTVAAPDPTA
jgi:4-diphosphocytidyl-2-C-methyl-D-erythritol kinase